MGKVRKEGIRPLFFPINKNYLEVYGKNDFYIDMDLKEYGYDAIIKDMVIYSEDKRLIIVTWNS